MEIDGRRVLFDGRLALRAGVRALVRTAAKRLLLFCIADDHVHAVIRIPGGGAREVGFLESLRSGEVDGQFFYLPPAGLIQLQKDDNLSLDFGKSLVYFALVTANGDGPLGDVRVRQALSAIIDRTAVAGVVLQGAALPAPTQRSGRCRIECSAALPGRWRLPYACAARCATSAAARGPASDCCRAFFLPCCWV